MTAARSFHRTFPVDVQDRLANDVRRILASGRLTLGHYTDTFEHEFAASIGARHAVAVASGTAALDLSLRALEVRGRRVLVPTTSNYATAASVLAAGGMVDLYDSDLRVHADDVLARIRPEVGALVVAPMGGYLSTDLPVLQDACERAGVPMVEDAAQAQGSSAAGVPAGRWGIAGTFSFYPSKVMTTGEGGIIVTDDDSLAEACRRLRNQGKGDDDRLHVLLGYNYRLTEVQAAMGVVELQHIGHRVERRRDLVARYTAGLKGRVRAAEIPDDHVVNGYRWVGHAEVGFRARVDVGLRDAGLPTAPGVYEVPLHRQPVFAGRFGSGFLRSDAFASTHFCLPTLDALTDEDVDQVITTVAGLRDTEEGRE